MQGPPAPGGLPHATALLHIISSLQQQLSRLQQSAGGGAIQPLQVWFLCRLHCC